MAMTENSAQTNSGAGGRWLQLGLVSATVAAPLIARWRSLAEDDRIQALQERAATLREQAAQRWKEAGKRASALRRTLGHAQAEGALDASDAKNARVAHAIAPLVALVPDAPALADAALATNARRRAALTASFAVAGVSVGLIAAGAITYIVLRNRALAREERAEFASLRRASVGSVDDLERVVEMVDTAPTPDISSSSHERSSMANDSTREPGLAPEFVFSDEDGAGAEWIGDVYTREYLPASAALGPKLPAPSRRVYFASEAQALAAGYHRDGFGSEQGQ
jgi:hypothetical protein